MIKKTYNATFEKAEQLVDGSREVIAVISTDDVDRDNEVVNPKGLMKKQYQGNPVVLFNHDYKQLPIGKCKWIKADGNKIKACYKITDKTQLGQDVFNLMQEGVLCAHSIGFNSMECSPPTEKELRARPDWAGAKTIHRKWEMLEFSVVTIPANPNAVTERVAKSLSPQTREFLGPDFEPRGDCWEWKEDVIKEQPKPEVVKEVEKPQPIKRPQYSKRIKSAEERIREIIQNDTHKDILRLIKGKA